VEFVEKNDFSKLFPRKIAIFPNIFRGIFPVKNVRKIGPRWMYLLVEDFFAKAPKN
jgi:hypothetical protein